MPIINGYFEVPSDPVWDEIQCQIEYNVYDSTEMELTRVTVKGVSVISELTEWQLSDLEEQAWNHWENWADTKSAIECDHYEGLKEDDRQ